MRENPEQVAAGDVSVGKCHSEAKLPGTLLSTPQTICLLQALVAHYSNLYAAQKHRPADVIDDDIYCFIGVLLLSGYCTVPEKIGIRKIPQILTSLFLLPFRVFH